MIDTRKAVAEVAIVLATVRDARPDDDAVAAMAVELVDRVLEVVVEKAEHRHGSTPHFQNLPSELPFDPRP